MDRARVETRRQRRARRPGAGRKREGQKAGGGGLKGKGKRKMAGRWRWKAGREGGREKDREKEREGMEGGSRIPYTVTFVKAWLSPYTGNVRDGRYLYRVQLKNQECRFLSRLLYTPVVMGGTNATRK